MTGVFLLAFPALAQELASPSPPPAEAPANSQDGEFSAFDLYVGGTPYGAIFGNFGPGWFEPAVTEDILNILPAVRDPNALLPLFQGRIEKIRAIRGVGTIRVDDARFRLDMEVDQSQTILAAVGGLGEIEGSEKNLSIRNTLFGAGSSATDDFNPLGGSSLTHNTIMSKGSAALQSSGTLTQENGYDLQTALARRDFKAGAHDLTGYAGLLQTEGGMRFARSLDYTGLRLASNQTLLFRDVQLQGSGIELFLPRRAQVKIFRDSEQSGQVLYSRALDFGTVQIDTRSFPQGSYDIEIVTYDGGAVISRETRPFIKSQALPPRGKPVLSLDLGQTRQDLKQEGITIAVASARARITDWLGGGIGIAATAEDQVYEAGLTAQHGLSVFKSMGILETSLTGAFASDGPAGIEASAEWISKDASASLVGSKTYRRAPAGPGAFALSDRQAVNFNFSMPFEAWDERFFYGFSAEASRASASGKAYRYGPTLSHIFDDIGAYTPSAKIEFSRSDTDDRILAVLTLRDTNPVWSKSAEIDLSRVGPEESASAIAALAYTGRNTVHDDWRRKLDASLGLRVDPLHSNIRPSETIASGDLQYTGDFARAKAFLEQSLTQAAAGNAGGEMESTLIWSPGAGLRATGENAAQDMALLIVTLGGAKGAVFDITVNGMTRGTVKTGESAIIPLPAYEQVRIGAVDRQGGGAMKVKESGQTIMGYPGNVAYRALTAVQSWVIMGTLAREDGAPLANERFVLNGNAYYADETGFFTIEESAAEGDMLEMEGFTFTCAPRMPAAEDGAMLIELGTVTCATKSPGPT